MKTSKKNLLQYSTALWVVVVISLLSLNSAFAQTKRVQRVAVTQASAPSTLDATVYQIENTLKFKVHFENRNADDVTIKIRNSAEQVVYNETVKNSNKYIRKFDLSTLPDGMYTFEVSNKQHTYSKDIQLQTMTARSLEIDE